MAGMAGGTEERGVAFDGDVMLVPCAGGTLLEVLQVSHLHLPVCRSQSGRIAMHCMPCIGGWQCCCHMHFGCMG